MWIVTSRIVQLSLLPLSHQVSCSKELDVLLVQYSYSDLLSGPSTGTASLVVHTLFSGEPLVRSRAFSLYAPLLPILWAVLLLFRRHYWYYRRHLVPVILALVLGCSAVLVLVLVLPLCSKKGTATVSSATTTGRSAHWYW
jgi:hypothetical protein